MLFRTLTIEDRAAVCALIEASGTQACDASFANMIMWQDIYPAEVCIQDGFFFRRSTGKRGTRYAFPLGGGDACSALVRIREEALRTGGEPVFSGLTEAEAETVSAVFSGLPLRRDAQPNRADYIYLTEDLAGLRGKKFHAKRNHINRFRQVYGDAGRTVPVTPVLLDALWQFNKAWCEENGCTHGVRAELCAIKTLFRHYAALELTGLALYTGGKLAGYTVASHLSGVTADVHIEKADYDTEGAYAVINQALAEQLSGRYVYLNREEDMGDPGIRKAKQSYRPALHLMRYDLYLGEQAVAE